jgi:hypothetical protein
MGCDYYIITEIVVEYAEEIEGNIFDNQYWDFISKSPRYFTHDEYLYTYKEIMELENDKQLDVIYYENGQWMMNCVKDKFAKYFEKFGHDNILKIYKITYACERN